MSHRRVKALGYEDDYDDEDEYGDGDEYEGGNGNINPSNCMKVIILTFQQR
jgi:hypothetical protein